MTPAECTEPMQTGVFYPQNELPTGVLIHVIACSLLPA
jgi:hypothetical protein